MKGRGRARGKKGEKCMASSQTANYNLNQWAASDQFLRTEFNADNSRIDAALKALSAQAASQDGAKCELTFGSYAGDGALTRTITLGFTPRAVFVISASGATLINNITRGGLALPGLPVQVNDCTLVKIVTNGFQVARGYLSSNTYYADANHVNLTYYYAAVK